MNKRWPGADPTQRREYEDSTATLRPPLARIKKTDRLIDEIGCKLCGLTDEEIGIVEQAVG